MGFLLIFLFPMAAVLLRLFYSLWASGNGLCLWVQDNLQPLNALVHNYSWHCTVWSVSFQTLGGFETWGVSSSVSLPLLFSPLDCVAVVVKADSSNAHVICLLAVPAVGEHPSGPKVDRLRRCR